MSAGEGMRWSREDLERARALAREHLKTQSAIPVSAAPSSREVITPAYGPLFRAAAVRLRFRMEEIQEGSSDRAEAERLRELSLPLRERGGVEWRTLPPEVRNDVLRGMTATELLQEIDRKPDSADAVQNAVRRALQGIVRDDLLKMASAELAALVQLYEGLSQQVTLPSRDLLERKLDLVRLLEPLKTLTRMFSGRAAEQQKLRDYVGVVPPETLLGKAKKLLLAPFVSARKAPFLIHGLGGVGKTTLVAKFILDHALLDSELQFPFAYLDFDRPGLMARNPATILLEAVRQIGLQYETVYPSAEKFRARWEQSLRTALSTDTSVEKNVIDNFVLFLDTLEVREGPVLFVLDTFEEVQQRSSVSVAGLLALVDTLGQRVPRLRVVLAGRNAITSMPMQETVKLETFDNESAIAYLTGRAIDRAAAADIVARVGGSPLALTLALQIYGRDPKELRENVAYRVDAAELTDEIIQAQLFDRILSHIDDGNVQRLAHPGLVLRRVTPELIQKVLAGPCGIDVPDLARAKQLFDKLAAEGTLVTQPEPDVLVHRADVRRLMLGPLRQIAGPKVEAIHRLAVDYYSEKRDPISRAEEVYHRLSLQEPRDIIAPLVTPDMEQFLSGAIEELEPPEQALLAELLGLDLPPEAMQQADQVTWERGVSRTLKQMMQTPSADLQKGLTLLAGRTERSAATDLRVTEAMFLDLCGKAEARAVAEAGLKAYRQAGANEQLVSMLLVASVLDQKQENFDSAHSRLGEAEMIARRRDDPLMLAHVLRDRAALNHRRGRTGRRVAEVGPHRRLDAGRQR